MRVVVNLIVIGVDEYRKVADMAIESAEDAISLRLRAEPGETFDTSEISACLDYTISQLDGARTA